MDTLQGYKNKSKDYKALAFFPLLVFLGLFLGGGILFTIQGIEQPFGQIPLLASIVFAIIVAFIMNKTLSFEDKFNVFCKTAANEGVMMMVLIFMLAESFSSVSRAMGGVESVVNLGLSIIPSRLIIPGVFLVACFISVSTGTMVGTVVTVIPIAVGIIEASSVNPAVAMAAVLSGSMFGDNMSVISDTTIAATRGVGAEMKDKFRMNVLIALPAVLIASVLFAIFGRTGEIPVETLEFNFIKILPYFGVLIASIMGANVVLVLISGILASGIIGMLVSSMSFIDFMQAIQQGLDNMAGIAVLSILVRGLIGLIEIYGGIDWLLNSLTSRINSKRGAEFSMAILVSAITFSVLDNTVAIITSAPLVKKIGDEYGVIPARMASLLDIFSCVTMSLVPHSGTIAMLSLAGGISPLDIGRYSFYQIFLGIFTILSIVLGVYPGSKRKAELEKN